MRFEGKHKIGKMVAKQTTSRANIMHTITIKNQLQYNYRLQNPVYFLAKLEMGPIQEGNNIKWLKFLGTEVRRNHIVVIPKESGFNIFQIQNIQKLTDNNEINTLFNTLKIKTPSSPIWTRLKLII